MSGTYQLEHELEELGNILLSEGQSLLDAAELLRNLRDSKERDYNISQLKQRVKDNL